MPERKELQKEAAVEVKRTNQLPALDMSSFSSMSEIRIFSAMTLCILLYLDGNRSRTCVSNVLVLLHYSNICTVRIRHNRVIEMLRNAQFHCILYCSKLEVVIG